MTEWASSLSPILRVEVWLTTSLLALHCLHCTPPSLRVRLSLSRTTGPCTSISICHHLPCPTCCSTLIACKSSAIVPTSSPNIVMHLPPMQLSKASTMQNSAEWLQVCNAKSATATNGLQSSTHTLHAPKPWFDAECWQARQALRRACHLASVHHHHSSLLLAYKALLRRKRRAWEKCQNKELCCLAAKDPGKFWRQYSGSQKYVPTLQAMSATPSLLQLG